MIREPHLRKAPGSNKRLTQLDCEVGNHTGHFPITKTWRGWACPKHENGPTDEEWIALAARMSAT
jgi:hypothetical protein